MKRSIKKFAAFVLALALAFQAAAFVSPYKAFADEVPVVISAPVSTNNAESEYTEESLEALGFSYYGGSSLIGYYGEEADLVVPSVPGVTYLSVSYGPDVKTLTIPEGIDDVYIGGLYNVEKIVLPSTIKWLEIDNCDKLVSLDLSSLNLNGCYLSYCSKLEDVKLNKSQNVKLTDLPALKSINIPSNTSQLTINGTSYDAVKIDPNNVSDYKIKNGGLYRTETTWDEDSRVKVLSGIDSSLSTINVESGTVIIDKLNISGHYYKVDTINLPSSVEKINAYAFYGASGLKNINLPKNVISLGAYAFSGSGIESITIPASVTYINGDCFADYDGKVSLAKNTGVLRSYKDGIYIEEEWWGEKEYKLVYYPSDKTTIEFLEGTGDIGEHVLKNCSLRELTLPEGLYSLYLDLSNAKSLTTLTLSSTVAYVNTYGFRYAPALMNIFVDENNASFTSVDGCLYDKDMTTLYLAPTTKEEIRIPEGVLSLGYYAVHNSYIGDEYDDPDNYKEICPTVYFPKSIENFEWYGFSFGKAYVYADTNLALYLDYMNSDIREWSDDDSMYLENRYDYELLDPAKDLLNSIYVIDTVTVKKGKKTTDATVNNGVITPDGVLAASKLIVGNNSECQVTYKSSNKKIAKVNKTTGEIKGVKKGTCTINVKCVINTGKKKYSKTFKIKVKVK
ncbi:MAG: leucine-rich repeat domain-containing protein [Lachnospiraceae bacterium]|nr:leucine-rich repeat domain-containing protein [Lachnospiraceae bacterium]